MKQFGLCLCFLVFMLSESMAQQTITIESHKPTPQNFQYLLLNNRSVSSNDSINELLVDLVRPMLLDSAIEKKRQHHKVFLVGWAIHAFGGYNWRAMDMTKQKFVGTIARTTRSSEEQFTEYDINFDMYFKLPHYLKKITLAYDRQRELGRQDYRKSHRTDYSKSPFVRDTANIINAHYRLHCELTPAGPFRDQLHHAFYPTRPGITLEQHRNFGTNMPTMGMYGTWCLDCNHSCHPEVHPYEWIWWLKATDSDTTTQKEWLIGLFHESSNRLKNWSQNPMTGTISIPFAFNALMYDSIAFPIEVEHLVFNSFNAIDSSLTAGSSSSFASSETGHVVKLNSGSSTAQIVVTFNHTLPSKNLQYWFSSLNHDLETHIISGYLNFVISANDLYTARMRMGKK